MKIYQQIHLFLIDLSIYLLLRRLVLRSPREQSLIALFVYSVIHSHLTNALSLSPFLNSTGREAFKSSSPFSQILIEYRNDRKATSSSATGRHIAVAMAPAPLDNLSPPGSSTYSSNILYVGDGTWNAAKNDFLLPNLVGLNFETMRYNGGFFPSTPRQNRSYILCRLLYRLLISA